MVPVWWHYAQTADPSTARLRRFAQDDNESKVAGRHYDEAQLATLVLNIALTNFWNRVNMPTRQVAGEW